MNKKYNKFNVGEYSDEECKVINNLPKIIYPKITEVYSNIFCKCFSQTEVFNDLYRKDSVRNIIDKDISELRLSYSPDDKKLLLENVKIIIDKEKILCDDYYVVYHGTLRIHTFLYQIQTIIRHIILGKDMNKNCLLFRIFPESSKYKVKDVESFFEYIKYKAKESHTKFDIGNLDHELWWKKKAMAVNLSLFQGSGGENSFQYFISAHSRTSPTYIKNTIKKVINLFPMEREYNQMFTKMFYMYFEQYYSGAKSSLYQIFIKKEVVDSLLYISTPYGWPLPIKASEVLSSLQKNNFNSSILPKINHSNFGKEINKININPEETKRHLRMYNLKNNLDNLQARYIASAEEIIMKDDNVICHLCQKSIIPVALYGLLKF